MLIFLASALSVSFLVRRFFSVSAAAAIVQVFFVTSEEAMGKIQPGIPGFPLELPPFHLLSSHSVPQGASFTPEISIITSLADNSHTPHFSRGSACCQALKQQSRWTPALSSGRFAGLSVMPQESCKVGLNPHLQMGHWGAERGLEPGLRPPCLSGLRDCPVPTSTVILTAAFGCCPHADYWCHQTLAPGAPGGVLCGLNPSVLPVSSGVGPPRSRDEVSPALTIRCHTSQLALACFPNPELQSCTYCSSTQAASICLTLLPLGKVHSQFKAKSSVTYPGNCSLVSPPEALIWGEVPL